MIPFAAVVLLTICGFITAALVAIAIGGTRAKRREVWVAAEDETCEFQVRNRSNPNVHT
jgi:hypothetical protein